MYGFRRPFFAPSFVYPSTHISTRPPIYLPVHPYIYPSTHISTRPHIYLPVHTYIYPSTHISTHPHIYLPVHTYIYPSTHISTRPPIYLPVHPYIYPSTTVFTHPNDGWTGLCRKLFHHIYITKQRFSVSWWSHVSVSFAYVELKFCM